MPLFFLIPLFIAFGTGYIFKKATSEISYLAGGLTVLSLIVSLVISPWEVQLFLLVVVLVTTNKLLQQNAYKLKLQDYNDNLTQPENTKVATIHKYRGANYPAVNFTAEFNSPDS